MVNGTVWINATANDTNHVVKMEIYINDTLVHYQTYDSEQANISYEWDTTLYEDGKYNVTVVAYDSLGNKGYETKFYYVENVPPIQEPIETTLVVLAIAIISLLIIRIVYKKPSIYLKLFTLLL